MAQALWSQPGRSSRGPQPLFASDAQQQASSRPSPSRWPNGSGPPACRHSRGIRSPAFPLGAGIPPEMGDHLMPSGHRAPPSRSNGVQEDPHPFKYWQEQRPVSVAIHGTAESVNAAFRRAVEDAASDAIQERGKFAMALTSGPALEAARALSAADIDWSKVHAFFADERCVPLDSDSSNFKAIDQALLSRVAIPRENIHTISGSKSASLEATTYEVELRCQPSDVLPLDASGRPVFDLVALGMGRDGSVASVYPNSKQIAGSEGVVSVVENAPEEPRKRVALTLPTINAARRILLPVTGDSYKEVVQRTLEVQALPGALPAQMVCPESGSALWLLDEAAASSLAVEKWGDKKAFPRNEPPSQPGSAEEKEDD